VTESIFKPKEQPIPEPIEPKVIFYSELWQKQLRNLDMNNIRAKSLSLMKQLRAADQPYIDKVNNQYTGEQFVRKAEEFVDSDDEKSFPFKKAIAKAVK